MVTVWDFKDFGVFSKPGGCKMPRFQGFAGVVNIQKAESLPMKLTLESLNPTTVLEVCYIPILW